MGLAGEGDVDTGVDQDFGLVGVGEGEGTRNQGGQFAGGQVLFADLDVFHAGGEGLGDGLDQGFGAAERAAIGDVVAEH